MSRATRYPCTICKSTQPPPHIRWSVNLQRLFTLCTQCLQDIGHPPEQLTLQIKPLEEAKPATTAPPKNPAD